ncbi:MAG: PIN domain-containing protein [Isosphaeraceae bacterium]
MNKALLDTDIYSEVLKAINPTVAQNAATYRQTHGVLTLSVITMLEIVKGCQQAQATGRMQRFLNAVAQEEVLSLEAPAAELAGRIAGDLDRTGQTIGMADPIIAAIALEHNLELVTGNAAHFQRIVRLGYPLTLVNWR